MVRNAAWIPSYVQPRTEILGLASRMGCTTPGVHRIMDLSPAKKPTQRLQDLGQSLWLDNIDRKLLKSGTLQRYIDTMSVTGLTSNPTIFDKAIDESDAYDAA